jgi:hypothetical protein
MNILIVSEKTSMSRAIAPLAREHWPTDNITFVQAVPYGNFKFSYPRGLRMEDYPRVSEPVHGLRSWSTWACRPLVLDALGKLTEVAMGEEHFKQADLIVFACDPDHTGAVAFDVLMAVVFGDDRAKDCPAMWLSSMDGPSIRRALADMAPFHQVAERSLAFGHIKRYFDWNWNVNALAILGDAARRAGVPTDAPPLSKYSLQVLYTLRDKLPLEEGKIAHLMTKWPGTGRYTYAPDQWRPCLGSAASVSQILQNLVEAGLLAELVPPGWMGPLKEYWKPPCRLTVSDRGHALLALLHPDCEDPDLPFRLDAWGNQGDAAKPAIDRYIRTFFGKQIRFRPKPAAVTG